jgi:biotin operon repressor
MGEDSMNILNLGNGTILEHGYGIVAKDVLKDRGLSVVSKAIYSYLCSYANNENKAFPSVEHIAFDLDVSVKSVYKYIRELREYGCITVTQERNEDGKFSRNIYTIELVKRNEPDSNLGSTETSTDFENKGYSGSPRAVSGNAEKQTSENPNTNMRLGDKFHTKNINTKNTIYKNNKYKNRYLEDVEGRAVERNRSGHENKPILRENIFNQRHWPNIDIDNPEKYGLK